MKYMLLIYYNEENLGDAERQQCYIDSAKLARDLNESGQFVSANPLHSISTATSVRVRDGKRLVTDGPFAETREQLGGYYLIEADSPDEVIEIAERVPMVHKGTVEVRPVMEIDGLPAS